MVQAGTWRAGCIRPTGHLCGAALKLRTVHSTSLRARPSPLHVQRSAAADNCPCGTFASGASACRSSLHSPITLQTPAIISKLASFTGSCTALAMACRCEASASGVRECRSSLIKLPFNIHHWNRMCFEIALTCMLVSVGMSHRRCGWACLVLCHSDLSGNQSINQLLSPH